MWCWERWHFWLLNSWYNYAEVQLQVNDIAFCAILFQLLLFLVSGEHRFEHGAKVVEITEQPQLSESFKIHVLHWPMVHIFVLCEAKYPCAEKGIAWHLQPSHLNIKQHDQKRQGFTSWMPITTQLKFLSPKKMAAQILPQDLKTYCVSSTAEHTLRLN